MNNDNSIINYQKLLNVNIFKIPLFQIHIIGNAKSGKSKFLDFVINNSADLTYYKQTLGIDYRSASYLYYPNNTSINIFFSEYSGSFVDSIGGYNTECFNKFINEGVNYYNGINIDFKVINKDNNCCNSLICEKSICLYFLDPYTLLDLLLSFETTNNCIKTLLGIKIHDNLENNLNNERVKIIYVYNDNHYNKFENKTITRKLKNINTQINQAKNSSIYYINFQDYSTIYILMNIILAYTTEYIINNFKK